jgi:hypothetical protein
MANRRLVNVGRTMANTLVYIITLPRPPFCATTTYLAYPLPLATPNRFGQARPLGACS